MKHTKKKILYHGGKQGNNPPTTFKKDMKKVKEKTKSTAKYLEGISKKGLKRTGDYMKKPGRFIDKWITTPALYVGTLGSIYYLDKALTDYELSKITLGDINSLGAIDCNKIDAKKILDDAISLRKQGKIFLSETNLKDMEEKNIINTRDRDILSRFDNKLREKINLKFFYTTQENTNDRSFIRVFLESLNAYVEKRDIILADESKMNMSNNKKAGMGTKSNPELNKLKKIILENLDKYKEELNDNLKNEKEILLNYKNNLPESLKSFYGDWYKSIIALEFSKFNLDRKIDESKKTNILTKFVNVKRTLSNLKDKNNKPKTEDQIIKDKEFIEEIDKVLKNADKVIDKINNLFTEFKRYFEVKTLLDIKNGKINTPINDKLIQEVNKIFFPNKYGEKKSREALQKRDVDFFGALYRRFVYLRLSIIRYNINKIFEYQKQEDKKDRIDEFITNNAYLLYFLVNEFVKVLRMHPVKDFFQKGTELNPNLAK